MLHVVPDDVSEGALFRENIKRLGETGLSFDLCVLPHQIPNAIALADLAPDVQFILDHCGVPAIASGAVQPWRDNMTEIAKRPNVTAKMSGVVAYAEAESWSVETLRPYVEHTIAQFGWDRVVWGSDWPVCTLGGGLSTGWLQHMPFWPGVRKRSATSFYRAMLKEFGVCRQAADVIRPSP